MRSVLEARSQANGTGTADTWDFSGRDERMLRDVLAGLDAFAVEPPVEVRRPRTSRYEQPEGDRWAAALRLWPHDSVSAFYSDRAPRRQAEAAWSAEGALALAELLPERFADLAAALRERFG